jgi:hypothetical protein
MVSFSADVEVDRAEQGVGAERADDLGEPLKAEAVQMVISTGKPIAEVARDLGIHDGDPGELSERLAAGASRN